MEEIALLKGKLRKPTEEDLKNLPYFSYSKLETYWNCPHHYYLKYINKNYQISKAIHFDIGNLCHGLLEEKAKKIINKEEFVLEDFKKMFYDGYTQDSDKGKEHINGVNEIAQEWGNKYCTEADKYGNTYQQKMNMFLDKVLPTALQEDKEWEVLDAEHEFKYVYSYAKGKEVILYGFIDSLRQNSKGEIMVVDYKTGKPFDEKKVVTAPQMCIYGMATYLEFEQLPVQYQYDFVLFKEKMNANTPGYLKRFLKKIDKTFTEIEALEKETKDLQPEKAKDYYKPNSCPLCYWCETRGNRQPEEQPERAPELPAIQWCDYWSEWEPDAPSRYTHTKWTDPRPKEEPKEPDIWSAKPNRNIKPSRKFTW